MSELEISRLDHCTERQLKELLRLAATDVRSTRNWLLEIGNSEQLKYLLDEMCAGIQQSGTSIVQAVCSADTPLEELVAIKSVAKRLAMAAETPEQNAAATLLYHLSVASALGHHARNISSKDPAERQRLYKDLAAELSDDELAAIFERSLARIASVTS